MPKKTTQVREVQSDLVRRPIEIIHKIEEQLKTSSFNRYNFRPLVMFPCITYTRLVLNDMHNSSRLVYDHGPFGHPSSLKKPFPDRCLFHLVDSMNQGNWTLMTNQMNRKKRTDLAMIFDSRKFKISSKQKQKLPNYLFRLPNNKINTSELCALSIDRAGLSWNYSSYESLACPLVGVEEEDFGFSGGVQEGKKN